MRRVAVFALYFTRPLDTETFDAFYCRGQWIVYAVHLWIRHSERTTGLFGVRLEGPLDRLAPPNDWKI